jgi:ABC-type amino acid transport substrate-binding protein
MQPKPAQTGGRRRDIRSRFGVPAIIVMSLMIGTCSRMPGTYEQIRLLGALKVATRNSPLAYYEGASGKEGPEYELAASFARRLGVKLELTVASSDSAALEDVLRNRAHIAAAGIVVSERRRKQALYGPVYLHIDQHIVYRVQDPLPAAPRDLIGKRIVVIANSTHSASLKRLARKFPGLRWTEVEDADQLDLFAQVARLDGIHAWAAFLSGTAPGIQAGGVRGDRVGTGAAQHRPLAAGRAPFRRTEGVRPAGRDPHAP